MCRGFQEDDESVKNHVDSLRFTKKYANMFVDP